MKFLVLLACVSLLLALLVPGSSADFAEDFGKKLHRDLCNSGCVNIFHDSSEDCVTACLNNDQGYAANAMVKLPAEERCPRVCDTKGEGEECIADCIARGDETERTSE